LREYDADVLTATRALSEYFERVAEASGDPRGAANWVMGDLLGALNAAHKDLAESPVTAEHLGELLALIGKGEISGKIAKDVFEIVWTEGGEPAAIVETRGLKQVTDTGAIEKIVDEIIAANPDKVAQAQAKPTMLGWFVGQAMKASGGKANPQAVNVLLRRKLGIPE
jgi:aspartyl-tRNA(Asn)/glutamyl-tRNA(Gln) amidotransferase subunit B